MCVWRRRPPTCFWPDGSPKFVVVLCWSNHRSRDRPNYGAPKSKPNPASQKLNLTKTLLWAYACKLFLKSDIFSKTFVGRPSVGVSRISWVSKPNSAHIDRIPRNLYTLSVRRICPLKLLKLEKKLAFFQAQGHDRLLFWRKLQWKFWMKGN